MALWSKVRVNSTGLKSLDKTQTLVSSKVSELYSGFLTKHIYVYRKFSNIAE